MKIFFSISITVKDKLFPVGYATDVLYELLEALESQDKPADDLSFPLTITKNNGDAFLKCEVKEIATK